MAQESSQRPPFLPGFLADLQAAEHAEDAGDARAAAQQARPDERSPTADAAGGPGAGDPRAAGSFVGRLFGGWHQGRRNGTDRRTASRRPGRETQGSLLFNDDASEPTTGPPQPPQHAAPAPEPSRRPRDDAPTTVARGEKAKARDLIAAIKTLSQVELQQRPATPDERQALARFAGFGPLALRIFPDPVSGQYKDHGWRAIGEQLRELLTTEEYDSAKRTTFNAFYTSTTLCHAMFAALARLGVPDDATVLEPGCGTGNFLCQATGGMRFIAVERDQISGRIARALHPQADIRIEDFQKTRLPSEGIDAVIGNVPFADLRLDYRGRKLALHDFFFAKSLDTLRPGGALALVTSHFTLDKQNAGVRETLAERADFLGAVRLPSDAFAREGTRVVTDIVFLRRRDADEPARHADPDWLTVAPLDIEGVPVPINRYFLNHPEMVLGTWSRKDRLYGGDSGYSLNGNGDLADSLAQAIERLPEFAPSRAAPRPDERPAPFVPPPPQAHITEGSLVVGEDRTIRQITDGRPEQVTYCGVLLRTDGTPNARKIGSLIELRDHARQVLQSQNEDWPEEHRQRARRDLNHAYDRFVARHGPINTTTFTPNRAGGTIRRMPNLVKFREDPDAMLVMALEDYDEVTGTATKAAIMHHDVVGRPPPVVAVRSAEDGLLVALDHRGTVDLPYIAALYGQPEDRIIAELDDLIYHDPESRTWQTADDYLAGNVRAKLALAESAGPDYARNAEALRLVQPEDVLPGDIDANLGAPWIPESDIRAFSAELFNVPDSAIRIAQLPKDALWSVDADATAELSVAATTEYGTPRMGGVRLLELALNLKSPVIHDTIHHGDREERVVNQEDTLAARDKQARIKDRFRSWAFAEPQRAERLVRIYNDTYNNLRPRQFDGAHLDFPGLNRTIQLRPHQEDAVWRGMSSGNTLLAHVVGAGKTFTMAATAMKMTQAGLVHKPMFVVPNHMLEQFGREFQQLYPNAHLLSAAKDDLARDRRKRLTAQVASGHWDGIVVTHSSFERIGMSRDYRERFLHAQIAEYDALLCDHARADTDRPHRNLIKTIEKQKARREQRLKDLLAEEKKDDGLVFDELGVDHLFIDEAHYFKNLETPTKMDRVAGIQTGGSERAFDLYMKTRYLHEQHAGHGVTFATGTPISNTMVELYTLNRFLDPEGLTSRGIAHFDAWAATFGEVVEALEIAPDGATLKPRSRFARFVNLPELQQMLHAFTDVQTAEQLDLPRPRLAGGKAEIVACTMSDAQTRIQMELVERYERLRKEKVDPREDNALAITTDGRKLALDARLLEATAEDVPDSKINALVDRVTDLWEQSAPTRGTQLVFCDLGVRPTPAGFSVYDEIRAKLQARGIPRDQIAAIGDADSDPKKHALFDKVRAGAVRVLLGSTQKMGTGTNVQKRLVALHHLDAPWKPAEVEQREGRILRQGNRHEEVAILRYVTEGSFDAYMWQALQTKARFIAQVITGQAATRRADDIGGQELSYAEVKAIASGNPAVLTLAEADAELGRLAILRKVHADEQFLARRNVRELPETIARLTQYLADLRADQGTCSAHADAPITVGNRSYNRADATEMLAGKLETLPDHVPGIRRIPFGEYRRLSFGLVLHPLGAPEVFLEGATTRKTNLASNARGARAILNAAERLVGSYGPHAGHVEQDLVIARDQLRDYQSRLGAPFSHEDYLAELSRLRDQLRVGLSGATPEPGAPPLPSVAELAEQIQALKAANTVEATSARPGIRTTQTAEVPVTTRIRLRRTQPHEPDAGNWEESTTLPEVPSPDPPNPTAAGPIADAQPEAIPPPANDPGEQSNHRSDLAAFSQVARRRRGAGPQMRLF